MIDSKQVSRQDQCSDLRKGVRDKGFGISRLAGCQPPSRAGTPAGSLRGARRCAAPCRAKKGGNIHPLLPCGKGWSVVVTHLPSPVYAYTYLRLRQQGRRAGRAGIFEGSQNDGFGQGKVSWSDFCYMYLNQWPRSRGGRRTGAHGARPRDRRRKGGFEGPQVLSRYHLAQKVLAVNGHPAGR